VPQRLLDDRIRGGLRADSLRLDRLDWSVDGARSITGLLTGQLAVSGTMQRPVAEGALRLDDGRVTVEDLGITPHNISMRVRANADSLLLESLRMESGGSRDTLGIRGVLHLHEGEPAEVRMEVGARTFQLARRTDGTDVDLSGRVQLVGPLTRPVISGLVQIPRATLAIDPLAARTALDLTSETARALLGAGEMPVAASGAEGMATLGQRVQVDSLRVELANDVWVQTPEARMKLAGGLDVASARDRLTLAGEIRADRGQYRLDLGLVSRSFSVDSGRVRFFAEPTVPTTLDIRATHVVRDAGGTEIPVGVHIGGNYDRPVLTLSSTDPLYAAAPESEIISLLLFGSPTFALDGQRQSTVQVVTGVLLPSVGGAVEGALQRLLPVFNTVQVTTAGRQGATDLTAFSLLDNLSISAGKQLGERTFLRLNTGVCRGAGQATIRGASLWYGVAAEHRLAPHLIGQVGVDPGAAPCARLGAEVLPRLQFGFDLFREWIW
jgi:translocation and assembly module TamB